MSKQIFGLCVGVALTFSFNAMAASKGAGCGLGSQLFEGQSGMVPNVLAMTTNGISSNNTFGVTSGTSGCDADSVVLRQHEQKVFVAANFDNLSQDMARGEGEYLHSLAGLMGCSTAVFTDFASLTKKKYDVLVGEGSDAPEALLSGLKREMGAHPTLSACTRLS